MPEQDEVLYKNLNSSSSLHSIQNVDEVISVIIHLSDHQLVMYLATPVNGRLHVDRFKAAKLCMGPNTDDREIYIIILLASTNKTKYRL